HAWHEPEALVPRVAHDWRELSAVARDAPPEARRTAPADGYPSPMTTPPVPTVDEIRLLPKVVLHDHLDGGLRPQTILELAEPIGHQLPANDAESLGRWFVDAADSGSLVKYLETFDHTIAVMQTADALERVAREAVLDLAADGVVYAEQRRAPEQHLRGGHSLQEIGRAPGRERVERL